MFQARLRAVLILVARVFVGLLAPALLGLAWLSAKDSVVEQARLSRLEQDGQRVVGTIVRIDIEKRRPTLTSGGEDRTRWEYWRFARVKYTFAGRDYLPDPPHHLTGPQESLQIGDPFPLIVLPDLPGRPYAPDTIVGSWIAVFVQPVLLLLVAALALFCAARRDLWT